VGRLADAERGYRQLLAAQPDHADSLHLLGVIGYQAGQHETAAALIERAIAVHEGDPSFHCNLGLVLQALQRAAEAEASYRRALGLKADHAEALNNLGNVLQAWGRMEEAAAHYRQALAVRPGDAQTHNNLGLVLEAVGRRDEAMASYRQALAIAPELADAHLNLGNLLQASDRKDEAVSHYRLALAARPQDPQTHNNLANTLQALGRMEEAVAHYTRALAIHPQYAEAHNNLGNVLLAFGKRDEAVRCYQRALAIAPNYVEAHNNLGIALQAVGRLEAAESCYRTALAITPDYAEAHSNLGQVLKALDRMEEAAVCCARAIELRPEYAEAHCNLGNALLALGRLDEAMECYARSLVIQAELAEARLGAANVLLALDRLEEAETRYAELLELRPEYGQAHLNLAFAQLRRGDLANGWRSHEWRWRLEEPSSARLHFAEPQWRGEPLQGARILIHCEQGLGDSLQFLRYVPMVQAAGGTVLLRVPASLRRIANGLPGVARIVVFGEPLPEFAWHCPLMSLPLAFGTRLESIPAALPYLAISEAARARAAACLAAGPDGGLRVGLVWAGNPKHGNDRFRSLAFPLLQPILRVDGVRFFSLQVGRAATEMASFAANAAKVTNLAPEMGDMEDTAALIDQLDLVIAVDTAVAHLAGALGRPLWVLLCRNADWRWLRSGETSPWYPTARLFRQSVLGDWTEPMARVAASLRSFNASETC
jgi:tetratricopeptide (TPR) repeat protein